MKQTIPFSCPHCGLHTEVAAEYAHQTGLCAGCRKPVTVPGVPATSRHQVARRGRLFRTLWVAATLALILGLGSAIFLFIFIAAFRPSSLPFFAGSAPPPPACRENLELIGQAIAAYVKDQGHYPPAYTVDSAGKPLHSWRVLILPYLRQERLYARIDLAKPWDDPVNKPLHNRMPEVYGCPLDSNRYSQETSYVVINGPTLLFDGSVERQPNELADGPGNTLLVVEGVDLGVHWMEPKDLDVKTINWMINTSAGLGSKHLCGGMHVLMADGSVWHFGDFVPADELQAMATIRGGESVSAGVWTDSPE